jgi:hypothetical protein
MTDSTRLIDGVAREIAGLDVAQLRNAILDEYTAVASEQERGFHFHTGRRLAAILEYQKEWLEGVPEPTIASFAGTGNPFIAGRLNPGDHVVDVGCGAGIDSMIAAKMVASDGRVVGVDMTAWSPRGTTVHYRGGGKFMAADLALGGAGLLRRRALFDDVYYSGGPSRANYGITSDGRAFLFTRATGEGSRNILTMNWFEDVRARFARQQE